LARFIGATVVATALGSGIGFAGTITLTSGTTGTLFPSQSFNETRGVDVTVSPGPGVSVTAMTLEGLQTGPGTPTFVGARIYDSSAALVASGGTTVTLGGTVTVPISATLAAGASYRVCFFVETTPTGGASGILFDPNPPSSGGFPYTEATGQLTINSAHSFPADTYPTFANIFVPQIELLTSTGLQSCFPGIGGVIPCPCGQPANPAGGCANFGAGSTTGAVLTAVGTADLSDDLAAATLFLSTTNQRSPPQGILNVFFSYKPGTPTPTTGIPNGAGVRCLGTGGDLRRFYTVQVRGGAAAMPGPGGPSVSQLSANTPAHTIVAPETRYYFNVYRDGQASVPCGSAAVSTNLTNLTAVGWVP